MFSVKLKLKDEGIMHGIPWMSDQDHGVRVDGLSLGTVIGTEILSGKPWLPWPLRLVPCSPVLGVIHVPIE